MVGSKFASAFLISALAVVNAGVGADDGSHRRMVKRYKEDEAHKILAEWERNTSHHRRAPPPADAFTPTGSSQNDVECSDLELIYVRSGGELQLSLGFLGMPLYDEMRQLKPSGVSVHNLVYNSAMTELFMSSTAGADAASKHITEMAAKCPKQRFALVGYSKGTLVVHQIRAATPEIANRIVAVAVIGDALNRLSPLPPGVTNNTWPVSQDRVKALCNLPDDVICAPMGTSMDAHVFTAYVGQIPALAKWIIDQYNKLR